MVPATRFTSLDAVETWDARYRWRQDGRLRDTTIDATWWRVAESVAAVEGPQAPLWAHRFADAFSRWRLLPDERLLELAGTGTPCTGLTAPSAVVNVAAFVQVDATYPAQFDRSRFVEASALAVRLLDDALLLQGDGPGGLHIGIIGLADAFHMLEMPFGSARAREFATIVASSLAEGCLRGNIDVASERGARDTPLGRDAACATFAQREMPEWLVEQARRCGIRHARTTAIEPHPHLVRLANDATDTLDARVDDATVGHDERGNCVRIAQVRMAAAMQPFIDRKIEHPALLLEGCFALATGCNDAGCTSA